MGERTMDGHLLTVVRLTVVREGGGHATPICSCGWTGRTCETPMAAGMEFAMNHQQEGTTTMNTTYPEPSTENLRTAVGDLCVQVAKLAGHLLDSTPTARPHTKAVVDACYEIKRALDGDMAFDESIGGGWFHARDGWLFRREPYGSVTIEKRTNDRAQIPEQHVSFDADTWASIVSVVSAEGENGETFAKAKAFHQAHRDDGGPKTPWNDGDDDIAAESRGNTTYAAIYGISGARVTIFAIRNIPAIRTPIATPVAYCDGEDQIDGVVENLKARDN